MEMDKRGTQSKVLRKKKYPTKAKGDLGMGKSVMVFDLDMGYWYKAEVVAQTTNYVKLSYSGWGRRYEQPWLRRDSDRIASYRGGQWSYVRSSNGAWRRNPKNKPTSMDERANIQSQSQGDQETESHEANAKETRVCRTREVNQGEVCKINDRSRGQHIGGGGGTDVKEKRRGVRHGQDGAQKNARRKLVRKTEALKCHLQQCNSMIGNEFKELTQPRLYKRTYKQEGFPYRSKNKVKTQ